MDKIQIAIEKARSSAFSMHPYSVNVQASRFISSIMLHTHYALHEEETALSAEEFLKTATPAFQRDNNKWNEKQKIQFVQNVFRGMSTNIMLFRMSELDDAQIIDGLQRTTALLDFLEGRIRIFGGLSVDDIGARLKAFPSKMTISIFTFDKWEDVGRFYIEINEGITHSPEDIEKCKKWFLASKNIKL